jgi:indolepyruvate decarboxylase
MGFAVPAALGVGKRLRRHDRGCRDRRRRRVSDDRHGAERRSCDAPAYRSIVILLEQSAATAPSALLHPGDFNDINPWKYHKLPEILNGGVGYEVRTEGEFDAALSAAWKETEGLHLIHAHLPLDDHSKALNRLAEKLSKRV